MLYQHLLERDPELHEHILNEIRRKTRNLEMIPSENITSLAVMEALGSILTDKYSEGYPYKRYYGGNENYDAIENLARERAKNLFGVSHANVQPYSGSVANQAAYMALLNPGDKVLGMQLSYGGHLTHGLKVNFSGHYYQAVNYTTGADGFIDYDAIAEIAKKEKPAMIICGATAYPRQLDFARFAKIARNIGAWLLADISHIAGLIIAGEHPSPVGHADVVMTTTHKTLRGPRGALLLCNGNPSNPLKTVERSRENIPTLIDRAVFPGLQGGPHNHQTAAIAVALKEAATTEFKIYGQQIVSNAKALANTLNTLGAKLITGGTDNHLLLMDATPYGIGGQDAERALGAIGITVNKNTVPGDTRKPFDPSGIRFGTPAITTRGMNADHMPKIAEWMHAALTHANDESYLASLKETVQSFANEFPLYSGLL